MTSRHGERGSILLLAALSMVMLLGIVALAIDASFMYTERDRMSGAADAAAKSAALELVHHPSSDLQAFANRDVVMNGFTPSPDGDTHVEVVAPPDHGAYASKPKYVQVTVWRDTPTLFGTVLGWLSMRPTAYAVAGTSAPEDCLIVMDDLTIGNAEINMKGCNVHVGGDLIGNNPNADIQGPAAAAGSCSGGKHGLCDADTVTGAPPPQNPFEGLAAPSVSGSCGAATLNPLPPGCYSSIPASVTTLQSGTFKVTGKITLGSSLTGNGVLVYLTSTGSIDGNTGELDLTALDNNAPYAGIALYGDPGSTIDYKNGFRLKIKGAIAMAGTDVDFKNGIEIEDTGCTVFVFKSFQAKNGNGMVFNSDACASQFTNASFLGVTLAE